MKHEVEHAIAEVKVAYPESILTIREDGEGGAYVILEELDPGELYVQRKTWVGFRITFQYPYADTYPHFVRGDLTRVDGRALGEGTGSTTFEGRTAIQLSRRSNHLDPRTETVLIKLQKVLAWLATHP